MSKTVQNDPFLDVQQSFLIMIKLLFAPLHCIPVDLGQRRIHFSKQSEGFTTVLVWGRLNACLLVVQLLYSKVGR